MRVPHTKPFEFVIVEQVSAPIVAAPVFDMVPELLKLLQDKAPTVAALVPHVKAPLDVILPPTI